MASFSAGTAGGHADRGRKSSRDTSLRAALREAGFDPGPDLDPDPTLDPGPALDPDPVLEPEPSFHHDPAPPLDPSLELSLRLQENQRFEPAPDPVQVFSSTPHPTPSPMASEGAVPADGSGIREMAQRYAPKKTPPPWLGPARRPPWSMRIREAGAWTATIVISLSMIWFAAQYLVALPLQGEPPFVARQ